MKTVEKGSGCYTCKHKAACKFAGLHAEMCPDMKERKCLAYSKG